VASIRAITSGFLADDVMTLDTYTVAVQWTGAGLDPGMPLLPKLPVQIIPPGRRVPAQEKNMPARFDVRIFFGHYLVSGFWMPPIILRHIKQVGPNIL